jgi:hypothetical protein
MTKQFFLGNDKTTKSYKTLAALQKKLDACGFSEHRHYIVKTVDDRWTAVFPASNIQGGYLGLYACQGFMTIG